MVDGVTIKAARLGQTCHPVDPVALTKELQQRSGVLWVHVTATPSEAAETYLQETFGFHPLEVEDALSDQERPTLRADEASIFLVAPSVVLGGPRERYIEVAFFVEDHLLVTVATEDVPMVNHWFDRCLTRPKTVQGSVVFLLHSLLDSIVDAYFPAVDTLAEEIDRVEEAIYAGAQVDVADALLLKRRLLEMRRQVTPLRDVLNGLLRRDVGFLGPDSTAYYQDVFDHTLRMIEVIDMERDILASVIDAHLSIVSNNLNQVMRELTVYATILMSAGLIAGIYGMNFERMPELSWPFGYAFALAAMLAVGLGELWYFRRKGWI